MDARAAPTRAGHRHWIRSPWTRVTALYVGLTVIYGWPIVGAMGARLPFDAGDPALNAWILWWNAHAVPLTAAWWSAPIFFPAPGTFALSETLLALAPLTTPLQWAGASHVVAYNVAFLASFPAAALAAHALAHRLTGRHDAALLAGLAFGFNPYRAAQLPHLQVLWSCWMPLGLLGLHRYLESPRARFLALTGVCWLLNGLTSGYFLMYFAVLVGLWMLWFARSWRMWVAVGGTLAVASLAIAPVLAGYLQHQGALGLARDPGEISRFAADLSGLWVSRTAWLPAFWTLTPREEGSLYPGVVIMALSLAGGFIAWRAAGPTRWSRWRVVVALVGGYLAEAVLLTMWLGPWQVSVGGATVSMTRAGKPLFIAACLLAIAWLSDRRTREGWRRRSVFIFYGAAAIVMLILALGPVARAFGEVFWPRAPYLWVMDLPGGRALRVPARFAMLFVLCLSQFAALAFARLANGRTGLEPVVAVLALVIALEGWVPRMPTAPVPAPLDLSADARAGSAAVLELPVGDVFAETAAMLRAVGHRLPLVNGFSGYTPPHYFPLRNALAGHDRTALDVLRQFGTVLVLVHRARDPAGATEAFVAEQSGAERIGATGDGPMYRLPEAPLPPLDGTPVPIVAISANASRDLLPLITDGRPDTRWHSGTPAPGARLDLVLEASRPLSHIELDLGPFTYDYPKRLQVAVGVEERGKTIVWEGDTAGFAARGILMDLRRAPVVLPLPPGTAGDRVTLTLTTSQGGQLWSVTGLRVMGR